jgi:hypothetical protein
MIKLFAFESAVAEDIDGKRRQELKLIWKQRLLERANNVVTYVF